MDQNAASESPAAPARQIVLQKIYVKDASLEVPAAPQIFARQGQPQMDVALNTDVKGVGGESYLVTLALTVTAKLGEEVAFLVEVHQAGLFRVSGFATDAELQAVLGAYCPAQVFPFARETVSALIERGGFPQFLLQPINFDAMYLEHVNRSRAQAAETAAATAH